MAAVSPKALVGKLNALCRRALEAAAGLCLSRTNYNVEIEHWLIKMLEPANSDLTKLLRHYDLDAARVNRELTKALDALRTGNARAPELSPDILDWVREAWTLGSLEYGAYRIRSGYLLAALLGDRTLSVRIRGSSPELGKLQSDKVLKDVKTIIAGSSEDEAEAQEAGERAKDPGQARVAADSKTPALDQFTMNLTERARKGEIDPVIGRDFEIRQVIDILTRRRQNNPILTGEAGVGKTAVVEGFALRIVAGDVPPPLRNVTLRTLDLGLLQAGAGVKGEFENRLKSVIAEVKASTTPIILFIDEAHTLIGAGGQAGQGDAANLLKPALARGELRTVAATTWMEYKKYFETDPALKRRFQVVKVEEPDITKAMHMMRGFSQTLVKHFKIGILEEALEDAVKLSARYITDRQLPDKSVSLLDTACARVALSQSATPPDLEDARRTIELLDVEIGMLTRETTLGVDHAERLQELATRKKAAQDHLAVLEKQLTEEKRLVEQMHKVRTALEKGGQKPEEAARDAAELNKLETELEKVQGEQPLIFSVVDRQAIAQVVSGWTGIPVGKMVRDEIKTVLKLAERMEERVIGQSHALKAIAQRIQTSRAQLLDPRRPIGVFLLVGPSGVGKTETAMALADVLYGGDQNMVIINMSEYKESSKISNLTGSAKGLVGYGEPGALTDPVRRKPYCIVLLDEVEKAHTDVQELFYQVFDKGMLQDSSGNEIDFKNTIILLTSNAGTDAIMKLCADPDTIPDSAGLAEALRPELLKSFKPALLGRMSVVPYFPLADEVIRKIIHLQLKRIGDRFRTNHRVAFTYDDAMIGAIAGRCKEVESGARNIDSILTGTLLPELSREVLSCMAEGKTMEKVHVSVDAEGKFVYQIT